MTRKELIHSKTKRKINQRQIYFEDDFFFTNLNYIYIYIGP